MARTDTVGVTDVSPGAGMQRFFSCERNPLISDVGHSFGITEQLAGRPYSWFKLGQPCTPLSDVQSVLTRF
jgi:hypothetical protein